MWCYQQPANPKVTQALIAEVPELYLGLRFLAAAEGNQQILNLDPSVPTAALLAKTARRQHLEPESDYRSPNFTEARAKKWAGGSFQRSSSWEKEAEL